MTARHRLAPLLVVLLTAALGACSVQLPSEPGTGALALALQQTAASGDAYRLRTASLRVTGAGTDATFTPSEDEDVFRTELPAGDYTLELQPGWQLERQRNGLWSAVAASLASDNPQAFAIGAGELTSLALRFTVEDEPVELAPGSLAVQLQVGTAGTAGAGPGSGGSCTSGLVINEIDYDQEGSDTREFVELFNAGACPVPTAGLALLLRNGGAAGAPAYATIALDGVASEVAGGAYLLVGAAAVVAEAPVGTLALAPASFSLQNGPDAVELQADGAVLDSVAYGGAVAGAGEGAPAPADRGPGALARCPNGSDSGDNAADLVLRDPVTLGAANACP